MTTFSHSYIFQKLFGWSKNVEFVTMIDDLLKIIYYKLGGTGGGEQT